MAFHKPGDFTRLVPFRHFDSCKGTLSTRWHPGGLRYPFSSASHHVQLITFNHYPNHKFWTSRRCHITGFHLVDCTREKGSGLDMICAAYIWETTETDMIGIPRKTFGLTTVPLEKIKHIHTNAPADHKTLDQHSPLMQWRVIEQLTLDLTTATQQISSGFGVAAVWSGVR